MSMPKRNASSFHPPSVKELARELIDQAEKWLDTENDQLGGEKPKNLIGTPQEPILRNLLEAIRYGTFS